MTESITSYGELLPHAWQENLYMELMVFAVEPAVSNYP